MRVRGPKLNIAKRRAFWQRELFEKGVLIKTKLLEIKDC